VTSPARSDGATRDVAELRDAAAALDGHDRAVTAVDRDGVVVAWNARATSVTGWSEDAVRGKTLGELLHGHSRADLVEGLTHLSAGRGWTARLDLEGPRAKALPIEVSAEPVQAGGRVVGAAAVLRPLTAGHVERVVRELSAVLKHVPDATVVCDQHGRVTEWNPAAERVLGWSRPKMLGARIDQLVPSDAEEFFQQVWSQLADGQPVEPYEAVRHGPTGSEHLVTVHPTAFREHGAFAGVVATFRPVTGPRR
jgi:PAS domain S-box-containing protein